MTIERHTRNVGVAVLGPLGTYTYEAAYKIFGDSVDYQEQRTIAGGFKSPFLGGLSGLISPTDTARAVQNIVQIGVVPQENTIFGSVIETYDALRQPGSGFVKGEVILQIQHCLLVQHGVKLHEIEQVLSHEQALGQCQAFLSTHLSGAARIKTPSTASAAQTLLSSPRNCAAICSRICATLHDGLEVLCEGIQTQEANFTRFYIIVRDRTVQVPIDPQPAESKALLRLSISPPLTSGTPPADVVQYLTHSGLQVARIDRRPSPDDVPFRSVYFVEVTDASNNPSAPQSQDSDSWRATVEHAINIIRDMDGEVELIGLW